MSHPVFFRNHHGIQFRQCAACEGAGELTYDHPIGDPQLETAHRCHECGGDGDQRVTPVDTLELLRAERRLLKALRGSPDLLAGVRRRYDQRRADAMKPVTLPVHDWRSRMDPIAAEVFAPVFRAMGFAA
ncbi:hypothetical protein [Lysobacter sp. F6437]|uniref:hypothetical protein n=1 Tax=Lysobacter sp. F6437 TaxID=3459296 RepID=UPI00403D8C6F